MILKMLKVIPNVYQLTIRGVNIILIAQDKLTLIDTGFRGSSHLIVDFIRRLGRSPQEISLIIITHHHPDHIGSLNELKKLTQAKVAIHEADLLPDMQPPSLKLITKTLAILPFPFLNRFLNPELGEVEIKLKGGERLEPLDGLLVIHTPGHTPGSISLFSAQRKLLITSDTINNRHRNLRLPPKSVSSNLSQAINSIETLAELEFEILLCGHGKPLTEDAKVKVMELAKKNLG